MAQPLSDARASGSGRVELRCTLGQITDEGMGTNGQPAFVQVHLVRYLKVHVCFERTSSGILTVMTDTQLLGVSTLLRRPLLSSACVAGATCACVGCCMHA